MYSVLHFLVDARDQSQTISIWYWCNVNSNKHPLWPRCGEENLKSTALLNFESNGLKQKTPLGATPMSRSGHSDSPKCYQLCSDGLNFCCSVQMVSSDARLHPGFQLLLRMLVALVMVETRYKWSWPSFSVLIFWWLHSVTKLISNSCPERNTEFAALKSPPQSPHLNPLQGCGRVGDLHQGCANGKSIATAATVSMDQNLQHLVWKHAELCWY